jgi:hypothetical protein
VPHKEWRTNLGRTEALELFEASLALGIKEAAR